HSQPRRGFYAGRRGIPRAWPGSPGTATLPGQECPVPRRGKEEEAGPQRQARAGPPGAVPPPPPSQGSRAGLIPEVSSTSSSSKRSPFLYVTVYGTGSSSPNSFPWDSSRPTLTAKIGSAEERSSVPLPRHVPELALRAATKGGRPGGVRLIPPGGSARRTSVSCTWPAAASSRMRSHFDRPTGLVTSSPKLFWLSAKAL